MGDVDNRGPAIMIECLDYLDGLRAEKRFTAADRHPKRRSPQALKDFLPLFQG
jgi:hypothetical protein